MKKLLQMKFMLLLCALIVGSGTMWAADADVTYDFTASGWTVNNGTLSNGTVSFTGAGGANFKMNSGYFMMGKKDAYINFPTYTSPVSKIVVTGNSGGSASTGMNIFVGNTAVSTETTGSTGTNTYEIASGYQTAGTVYTLKVTSAHNAQITKIEVFFASSSPLASITLSGDYPTSFTEGDEFSHEGMTVTATYEDESTADVTSSASFTGYDMTVLGQNQTVTVSYSEGEVTKTAEYTIIVNALPSHNVTWSVNGTVTEPESYKEGAAITFPANPADIDGKSFVGWTETAISGTTDETPTFVTSATMGNADITYYAVFAEKTETAGDVTKAYGFETESDPDWTISGPVRTQGNANTGDYSGRITTNNTYVTFNNKVKVKEFSFAFKKTSNNNNYNVYIETSTDNASWTAAETYAMSGFSAVYSTKTKTFEGNTEMYIRFHCNNTTAERFVDDVTIKYDGTTISYSGYCTTVAADTREEADLSYSEGEVEIELKNESYNAVSDDSNPLINPKNLTDLTWSSTDETVATVSEGIVTLKAVGTTTITASFAGNDAYKPGSASFTLQVVDNRAAATVEFLDTNNNNEPITVLNLKKGDNILGITPSCSVSFTFEDTNIKPAWGTNATHDNYEGDMPATYTLSSGNVFAMNVGTMTVTATFPGNQTHKPASATLTINVTGGTATDPYTVAQARAAIDAEAGTSDVYVKGIVCTAGSLDNGSISYWISDDGTTNNRLEVYSGKSYNGDNFSNSNDIQVGDKVTVHGNLTKYYSTYEFEAGSQLISLVRKPEAPTFSPAAGTYTSLQTVTISAADGATIYYTTNGTDPTTESTQYSEPIAVNETTTIKAIAVKDSEVSDVATAEYVIDLTPSIVFDDKQSLNVLCTAGEADIHFVASNITGTVAVVLCDANGGAATYDWFSAALSNDNVHIQWQANEDPENSRTAFFKLTNGTTTSDVFALTQANYTVTYTLAHSITPGKHYIIASGTDGNVYVMGGQKSTNREAVEVEITTKNVISVTDEKICEFIVSKDGAYYTFFDENLNGYLNATGAGGTNNNHLKTLGVNDNKGQWSISINDGGVATVIANATGRNTMRFNNGNSKLFSCYSSGQQDIYLFEKDNDEGSLVIPIAAACTDGTKCYSTFSSTKPFVVSEDLTVSEIGIDTDGTMNVENYETGAVVPANTGVMVSAAIGDRSYVANVSTEVGNNVLNGDNRLRPTGDNGLAATEMNSAEPETCKFYRLTMHNGEKIGFWWGADGGNSFNIAANKAYLAVPASVAGARNGFVFGDDATGISNVNVNENVNGSIFDLQGRKVSKPGKGLYIVNGKKVVIK